MNDLLPHGKTLAAGLGKQLGQAQCGFAKKAADQGFVAHHQQGNGQFKGESFGERRFAVAWGAHQKKPVAGFEVVGAEQVSSLLLFYQLRTGLQHGGWKEQVLQPPLGPQLQEQARGTVEADRGDWGRGFAVTVELEMGGQPISEHVELGSLLGDQRLEREQKKLLAAHVPGGHDIDHHLRFNSKNWDSFIRIKPLDLLRRDENVVEPVRLVFENLF